MTESEKRLTDPAKLQDFKKHVDMLTAQLMVAAKPWNEVTIHDAVSAAMVIIAEVNRQVDRDLEHTMYEVEKK